jgi:hypothetical protein
MQMTSDPQASYFGKIVDRESLYEAGTVILGFKDDRLTEAQKDFKSCYDIWLGLGNGFSAVCQGTYLSSLPRAVAAFDRIGVSSIAVPGRLVITEYEKRGIRVTEITNGEFAIHDQTEIKSLYCAIKEIDDRYFERIFEEGANTEEKLIQLAASP